MEQSRTLQKKPNLKGRSELKNLDVLQSREPSGDT